MNTTDEIMNDDDNVLENIEIELTHEIYSMDMHIGREADLNSIIRNAEHIIKCFNEGKTAKGVHFKDGVVAVVLPERFPAPKLSYACRPTTADVWEIINGKKLSPIYAADVNDRRLDYAVLAFITAASLFREKKTNKIIDE